jgi:hypothetical protein
VLSEDIPRELRIPNTPSEAPQHSPGAEFRRRQRRFLIPQEVNRQARYATLEGLSLALVTRTNFTGGPTVGLMEWPIKHCGSAYKASLASHEQWVSSGGREREAPKGGRCFPCLSLSATTVSLAPRTTGQKRATEPVVDLS